MCVALCRYNVTRIEGTEVPFASCRWSWDTVYTSSNVRQQRKLLTRYIFIATIYKPSRRVKKLMGHGSTPSDPSPMWPIRFSWSIYPWPMTHSMLCCTWWHRAIMLTADVADFNPAKCECSGWFREGFFVSFLRIFGKVTVSECYSFIMFRPAATSYATDCANKTGLFWGGVTVNCWHKIKIWH